MDYRESFEYLLSLGNEVSAMKLGLESMTKLLRELGDPQTNYLKVQVAGTNGKGSVCSFLESICHCADLKIGVTTSPHLVSITQRVRINGKQISQQAFAGLATRVRDAAESLVEAGKLETVPTYFEQVTAVALVAFAEANVELAILETGIGGRLDATTAANAEIAVITRIDLDHQQYLGETIEKIAAEKAAIIHAYSRVVIGEQPDNAMKVILDRCSQLDLDASFAKDVQITRDNSGVGFQSARDNYRVGKLGLLGAHQIENAKTAILAAEVLSNNLHILPHHIESGLENARHPGRLEFSGRYLFDGAHNTGGARALREFLRESVDQPVTMVFAAMNDKEVIEMGEILFPLANKLILTRANNSRAAKPDALADIALKLFDEQRMYTASSVGEALIRAEMVSGPDSIILITGSLYLVGEAQQLLNGSEQI